MRHLLALIAQLGLLLAALTLAQGQLGIRAAPLAVFLIGVEIVVAAVLAQPAWRQFDDARHVPQQRAVVADHDQAAVPALQRVDQALAMVGVEVVAGFIQDQPLGTGQERTGQCDLHRLATAERRRRLQGIERGQPEQLPLCLQLLAQIPVLTDAAEVVRIDAAGFDAEQGIEHRTDPGQIGDAALGYAAVLGEQVHRPTAQDAAGGGREIAAEQTCEHAFAHAVAPDQTGRGAVERGGQFGKQDPAVGQGMRHAVERESECGHATSIGCQRLPSCGTGGWRRAVRRRRHQWRM